MNAPLAERRIALWSALGPQGLRLDRARLRFALGISLGDVQVPFQVTLEARTIVLRSARQLALMLVARHKDALPSDEYDRFLLLEEFGQIPEAGRWLGAQTGGPDIRHAAALASQGHPSLTGAVMAAWLGPGGGGRSLVALTLDLIRRAQAEKDAARGLEDTPTLALLMLTSTLPAAESILRAVGIPGAAERTLRGAAGVGVFSALQLATQLAFRQAAGGAEAHARADALISATVLLGGRAHALASGATLFGCELSAGIPGLDSAMTRLAAGEHVAAVEEGLLQALMEAGDAKGRAEAAVAETELRQRAALAATHGEGGALTEDLAALLRELVVKPKRLTELLADTKLRKALAQDLAEETSRVAQPAARTSLAGLAAVLKAYSEKEPASCVGHSRAQARAAYVRAALAFACDLSLDRSFLPARRALTTPTGTEAEGGLAGEYEAGRLYRISEKPEPLLRQVEGTAVGHLFVDVKDFTRRTSLMGQATMADFLRREFYVPILNSARSYHSGMVHLADHGGISLNNLLGDALSMSGDIEALVGLARDIRQHLAAYEQRLQRSISSVSVATAIRDIEQAYQTKARQAGADPSRLSAEKDAALARARGEGLEAGVFISFGPPPLVVTLEDEAFGRSKVAIADRINESARGTARSGGARGRADALLAAERSRSGNAGLSHPWQVFVGAPLALNVPFEIETEARAAMQRGDSDGAVRLLLGPLSKALSSAADTASEPAGDIYNAGAALSEESLRAFHDATAERRQFREVTLRPEELHPAIRERYFFTPEPLHLVVAFHPDGRMGEVFHFAGRALFKGFERQGGIGVWELASESGIAELFARYHASAWR